MTSKQRRWTAAELAREHTDWAVKRLRELAEHGNENVALGAIKELLARGWGQPTQHVESRAVVATAQLSPSPLAPREEWARWQAAQVAAGAPPWAQLPAEVVATLPPASSGGTEGSGGGTDGDPGPGNGRRVGETPADDGDPGDT